MKYFLLIVVLFALFSCEEKVEYDEEYKYGICLNVLEENFLSDINESYVINPEVKDFRINDVYILMFPERKYMYYESSGEQLKEMGLSLKTYEDASFLNTSNSFDLNKLQKHSSSSKVVRLSYIRNNMIFMDVITYCVDIAAENVKDVNEDDGPIYSITSFFIQIDDLGNAVYQNYNSLDYIIPCH